MLDISLGRKFRPQNFDKMAGQEHTSQTLKNLISKSIYSSEFIREVKKARI